MGIDGREAEAEAENLDREPQLRHLKNATI